MIIFILLILKSFIFFKIFDKTGKEQLVFLSIIRFNKFIYKNYN